MRTKNLFFTIVLFITALSVSAQSQNPGWILPPEYVPNMGGGYTSYSLPTIHTNNNASNMQLDANGDILFYIIDDEILDKDGDLIGSFKDHDNYLSDPNYISFSKTRSSEIAIIPDPANCSRFYIIECGESEHWDYGQNPIPNWSEPFVAVINFDLPRSGNPSKMGAIELIKPLDKYTVTVPFIEWRGGREPFIAASKLTTNNERFVFVFNPKDSKIYRYKIDNTGFNYDGEIALSAPYNSTIFGFPGEMELVSLPNNHFRIAVPYYYPLNHNGEGVSCAIYTAELNANGNVYSGNENTLYFYSSTNSQHDPYIHGLEFSSDGNILYIAHNISQHHPEPLEYYDFNNPNSSDPNGNGVYSLNIGSITGVTRSDFESSQIELAADGNLYLGAEGRLAKLSNPSTPNANSPTFTDYAISISGYTTTNQGVEPNINPPLYYNLSYTLPDQIDGMNYGNSAPAGYNEIVYTAQSSGVWELGLGNNPWDNTTGDVYIKEKLVIPTGKNVTIKNMTFHFAPGAKVVVEQGAKLTVDGGTLSNSSPCNNEEFFWQGVEVWGTSNQNQYPSNQPNYQGTLVLEDGGTIEYAIDGARNWKVGDYNKTGGVIQSKGGKFINNSRDVEFMSYQNFAPNNSSHKLTDLSHFTNTEFISNNDYIELSSDISRTHVTMWDVHGVLFSGCTFANNKTGSKWNSNTPYRGIHGIDASFTVKPLCTTPYTPCPSGNLQKSEFTGLNTAVEADGTGTSETVKVTQSEFHDIVKGVLIYEIDNASIDRNNIVLNDPGYNQNPSNPMLQTGIKIKNATGFTVEENDISANYSFFFSNSPFSNGIVINNSGTADNRVYKNNLNGLRIATSAFAINYEPTTAGDPSGLQFLCNNYSFNRFDIYVGNITNVDDGIRLFQGNYNNSQNARFPAGNKFSNVNSMGSWNLDNHNGTHIDYYYNTNESNAEPINTNGNYNQTTKALTTSRSTCPSSFGSGGLIFHSISLLSTKIDSLKNVYNDLQYNYLSLIDGGNTEQLQQTIDNSWSDDAWALRNQLIEKSPYLSTETLLKVADRQILPNAMLLGVLLANAEATRGSDFIDKLKEATHSSFPQYMINYVINNRDVKTTRTNLEGAMGSVKTQIALNQNIVKHKDKMRDSYDLADRQKTTEIGNSIFDRIGRADYYISQEQWSNATNAINSIKMNDTLKGQLDFIKHYEDYINFRENLGERKISQLDSSEIEQLKSWAEEKGRVAGYAQNILCFFYNTCYSDSLTVDEDASISSSNTTNSTPLNDVLYNLTISPNPASSNATISWTIYDQLQNCSYKVQNLNDGSVVAQGSITENEGSVTINVSQFQNGYYVVKISNNGKLKAERKLVIE